MFKRILMVFLVVAIIISIMCSCAQTDITKNIITHATESTEQVETVAETLSVISPSETSHLEETSGEPQFVYIEQFTEVPLYNQLDYTTTRYGDR